MLSVRRNGNDDFVCASEQRCSSIFKLDVLGMLRRQALQPSWHLVRSKQGLT